MDEIDEAVVLDIIEGVGPAIEHMSEAGRERDIALKVLASPKHYRKVKGGRRLAVELQERCPIWSPPPMEVVASRGKFA